MLRKSTDSLVIKPRLSPAVRLGLIVAAVLVVAGASLGGYWGGRAVLYERLASHAEEIERLEAQLSEARARRREAAAEHEAARRRLVANNEAERQRLVANAEAERERMAAELQDVRESLQADLATARAKLEDTRRRLEETRSSLTKVTRQLQIDQTAYAELRKELEASNREITELASELKFYRSIISPADGRSGVRIHEFELWPTGSDREYRYRLILIQALDHESSVQGGVRFEVSGTQGGEQRVIQSPPESEGPISAEFKYFQNFVGTFAFPAGFMPAEVRVIFEADDAMVQRTYPWPAREADAGA